MGSSTKFLFTFAALVAFAGSAHATPVLYCSSGPGGDNTLTIDLVNDGCISGEARPYPDGGDGEYENAGGGDPEDKVEEAIYQATGTAVDIEEYGASDNNPGLFVFTPGDPSTTSSGTWSVIDGTLIYYITVKAANSFALYELATPASSGSFDTIGILNNGGQQPNVSHITFWTAESSDPGDPVPEPTTALLLGAGGLLAYRRRQKQ